jgi:hypothetical protein
MQLIEAWLAAVAKAAFGVGGASPATGRGITGYCVAASDL